MGRTVKSKKPKVETKECRKCKATKPNIDFCYSRSFMHPDGRTDVCRECVYEYLKDKDISEIISFLAHTDLPFLSKVWFDEAKQNIGEYIKKMVKHQNKDKKFKDSDKESEVFPQLALVAQDDDTQGVPPEYIDKFGPGYTPQEYQAFERKYSELSKNYDEKTAMHSENLKTYIRYSVKAELATAAGLVKDAKEWGALAHDAAKNAKLNVNQLSKSDISGGVELITQLFEAVESEVGIIPHLPYLMEQPYDDADMIIWSMVNYSRRLEEKPRVTYEEIYKFYDEMIEEHCLQRGMSKQEIIEYKQKRKNVFRDMEQIYVEPLYAEDEEEDQVGDVD